MEHIEKEEDELKAIARSLAVSVFDAGARVSKLLEHVKQLEKKIEKGAVGTVEVEIKESNGVKFIAARVEAPSVVALRSLADQYKQKIGSGVVVLGAVIEGKVSLIVMVTKDLTAKYNAGDIVKKLAVQVGGTGGGRPEMAQGGGPEVTKLDFILSQTGNSILSF